MEKPTSSAVESSGGSLKAWSLGGAVQIQIIPEAPPSGRVRPVTPMTSSPGETVMSRKSVSRVHFQLSATLSAYYS